MNLDELRTVQSKERQKETLQHLRPSFYEEVAEYIADLRAERERLVETVEDPFSNQEVRYLTDDIETAREVTRKIYERRIGKIVKQASLAAAGMPADEEGMTTAERTLYEELVESIEGNMHHVLSVIEGADGETREETADQPGRSDGTGTESPGSPDGSESAGSANGPPSEDAIEAEGQADGRRGHPVGASEGGPGDASEGGPGVSMAEAMQPTEDSPTESAGAARSTRSDQTSPSDGTEARPESTEVAPSPESPSDESTPLDSVGEDAATSVTETTGDEQDGDETDRVTVRVTRDVGSILGTDDREYTLAAEDVVDLPAANARALLDREAAERLG